MTQPNKREWSVCKTILTRTLLIGVRTITHLSTTTINLVKYHFLSTQPIPHQVNWIKLAYHWQNTGREKLHFGGDAATWHCPLHCGHQESAMNFCVCTSELSIQHKTVHPNMLKINFSNAQSCTTLQKSNPSKYK